MPETDQLTPAYVPWSAFVAFIDRLSATALPPKIDFSLTHGMSGATQSHLRSAMRFLGLIDSNNVVTDSLRRLVKAYGKEDWASALSDVLGAYNAVVDGVELDTGTATQLRDAFRINGKVDGQVGDKAIRFYLTALKSAGLTVSPHFDRRGTKTAGRTKAAAKSAGKKAAGKKPIEPVVPVDRTKNQERDRNDTGAVVVPAGFIAHQFLLRKDLPPLTLPLPGDLTTGEADRLAKWLATLPLD